MSMDRDVRGKSGRRRLWPPLRAELLEDRRLLSVDFQNTTTAFQVVSDRAGVAAVTLVHSAGPFSAPAPEQVTFTVGGGDAVPGVDYAPVNETVTFAAGETSKTVYVPVFPGSPSLGNRYVQMTLSSAQGSTPGSFAFLEIVHNPDTTPPHVVSTSVRTRGQSVTGFTITFSKDMAPGPVQDVGNYVIVAPTSLRTMVRMKTFIAPQEIPLASAVYDPGTRTVTLTPAGKVNKSAFFTIMSPEVFNSLNLASQGGSPNVDPLSQLSPITDAAGNLLDSIGQGTPDGVLYTLAAPGRLGHSIVGRLSKALAR
jgi:hypothetical protein